MALKKMWLYKDSIGPVADKYSPAEIIGTLALIAGAYWLILLMVG